MIEELGSMPLDMVGTPYSYSDYATQASYVKVDRSELFSPSTDNCIKLHILRKNILINWKENFLEDLCIGSDLDAFKEIHRNPCYNTSDYYAISLVNSIVDLKTGSVFLNSSAAWADSCFAGILHGPTHLSPAIEARGNQRYFHMKKAEIRRIEVPHPVMIFCHWASLINYGHWLANALVAAYLMLPELQAGRLSLIGPRLSDRQKRELSMIGVPNSQIIETDSQYISAPNVIYSSACSTIGNMAPSPICIEVLESLKNKISVQIDQPSPEYIYVARKGASHSRTMLNEAALIDELAKIGFTAIYPHEMCFDAQIKSFKNAKFIIGQLGAALWSMPFAPRGGIFIEISTSNYASNEYISIANLMGRKSVQVMVNPNEKGGRNDVVLSFTAPIDNIVDIVKRLI